VVEERGLVAELERTHGPHAAFLEHDRIAHITYPYEWSISMVADAGIHTLVCDPPRGGLLAEGCDGLQHTVCRRPAALHRSAVVRARCASRRLVRAGSVPADVRVSAAARPLPGLGSALVLRRQSRWPQRQPGGGLVQRTPGVPAGCAARRHAPGALRKTLHQR
jgi:hypothetical protein